ncbi:MAG: uroporphyrinogen decarboxylase family protein [Promethearchaeati archaeon]
MGFDAVSLWDFRRVASDDNYNLEKNKERIDSWGRVYKNGWYSWEGVFKTEKIVETWSKLKTPNQKELKRLKKFLENTEGIDFFLSLPGLFEKTWQSMGFITFSKSLRNNIELINIVIQFFYDYLIKLIKLLQDSGASIFLIADDLGYKQRTFIPKNLIHELFFKKYQDIVEMIHSNQNHIILHSDGYISNLFDLIIEVGFDGIQSIESTAGNNIFELFKKYSNQICFIGNLDNGSLLTYSNPFKVDQYVRRLIRSAKKYNSRIIISPTQQLNTIVKPENVKAMINTVKDFNEDIFY